MTQQTDNALVEAQQRLANAQAVERARQDAASAPQREIERAQRDVARLTQQQRAEEFERTAVQNAAACEAVFVVHRNLIARLAEGDIAGARLLLAEAELAHDEHRRLFDYAMSIAQPEIEAAVQRQMATIAVHTAYTDAAAWNSATWEVSNRLRQAYTTDYALAQWVAQSPDAQTAQLRQGFAYALTGQFFNPPYNYDPLADYVSREQARRRA